MVVVRNFDLGFAARVVVAVAIVILRPCKAGPVTDDTLYILCSPMPCRVESLVIEWQPYMPSALAACFGLLWTHSRCIIWELNVFMYALGSST